MPGLAAVGIRVGFPRIVHAHLFAYDRRIQAGVTDGQSECVIEILVNVGKARAITMVSGITAEFGVRVLLGADVQYNRPPPVLQGPQGLQRNRAGQSLTDEAGIRSLVDDHTADELRRVLIELDTAVITGADLLAPI